MHGQKLSQESWYRMNTPEREMVHRGAQLLDTILPGWYTRVNLETLTMGNGTLCLLGQLFGEDTETALAREMYPELFSTVPDWFSAYHKGCQIIPQIATRAGLSTKTHEDIDYYPEDSDIRALGRACAGHDNKCEWAEEIAERLSVENSTHREDIANDQ